MPFKPPMKNRDYEQKRNALIPHAEAHADALHGAKDISKNKDPDWARNWNRAFLAKMDELAEKAGLMVQSIEKSKKEKLEEIGLSHNPCQGCEAFYTREGIQGMCAMEFDEACAWVVRHDDAMRK